MFNETEILDSRETVDSLGIEIGSIGWEDDPDPHFDIDQEADDGVTLVKVQLFRGRVPGSTPKKGIAQGHKILARLSSQHGGIWSIPKRGRQCIVNYPAGFQLAPGAAVITAVAGAYINDQFREDREIWDAGADTDILLKGRRVAIQDYEGNFLCVSPESGIQAVTAAGAGVHVKDGTVTIFAASGDPPDAKTMIVVAPAEASIIQKDDGGAFLKVSGGEVGMQGNALAAAVGQAVLGVAGQEPVVTLTKLLAWLNTHVHSVPGVTSGPSATVSLVPTVPATPAIASTTTFAM